MTRFPFRSALLATAIAVGIAACSDEPEPAAPAPETKPAEVAAAKTEAPAAEPKAPVSLDEARPMKRLTSADAPFACDIVTPQQVELYLGPEYQISDISAERKAQTMSPVTSTCLLYNGKDQASMTAGLIIDVWTDADVVAAGHRGIEGVWTYRASEHARRLDAIPDAWAAWVDSEHAPDRALLIRQGEVMLEFISQPYQSSADASAIPQDKIEQLAIEIMRSAATRAAETSTPAADAAPAADAPAAAAETKPAG